MIIKTSISDRKEIVKRVSQIAGEEAVYQGPPSFQYCCDDYLILRDGTISTDNREAYKLLQSALLEQGILKQEQEMLEINVPVEGTSAIYTNLLRMLHAQQYLLNRSIGYECFLIPDILINQLENVHPKSTEEFFHCYDVNIANMKGIAISSEHISFSFPLAKDGDRNRAYAELSVFLVEKAKKATWLSAKLQKPENEKFAFRTWLIRLGMVGRGSSATRKELLQNLKGNSAYCNKPE